MGEKLRPCCFCGHDGARVIAVDEVTDAGCEEATVPLYAASCWYCGARGPMALSEDEAVEAWNRRAGSACEQRRTRRACRYVRDHMGVAGNWFSKCSECGAEFDERVVDSHFVYCPECGARVIGEETGDAD